MGATDSREPMLLTLFFIGATLRIQLRPDQVDEHRKWLVDLLKEKIHKRIVNCVEMLPNVQFSTEFLIGFTILPLQQSNPEEGEEWKDN